jgi:hypothetical protein
VELSPLAGVPVSEPSQPAERAADARAAMVLARTAPAAAPPGAGVGLTGPARAPVMPADAPPAVARLAGRGEPLPAAARAYFEQRFATGLDHVRIHRDAEAATLAADAEARAFTVGSHIFFGAGEYDPASGPGRSLLAHELAHAEQAGTGAVLLRTPVCRDLLAIGSSRPSDPIGGNQAHRLITERFILANGSFRRLNIPAAARAPFDTEGCSSDAAPSEIDPLIYDPRPRTRRGMGIPDLIIRRGNRVEIGEIKPATWGCVAFGEAQVQNYVDKGNDDSAYRGRQAIKDFSVMPPSSWNALPGTIVVGDVDLLYNWCGQGVIGYLGVRRDDLATLLCGVSDQGRIDRFVDGLMNRAREQVESVINTVINERLSRLIAQLSLRELLTMVVGHEAAGRFVDPLTDPMQRQLELEVRAALHRLKDELVRRVKEQLRRQLRTLIAEIMATLCAGALVLSAAQVLEELRRRLRVLAWETAAVAVMAMVGEAVQALLGAIGDLILENWKALLALVVIAVCAVAIAFLVADDVSLIGIADDPLILPLLAVIRAAASQLGPLLRLLAPALAGA